MPGAQMIQIVVRDLLKLVEAWQGRVISCCVLAGSRCSPSRPDWEQIKCSPRRHRSWFAGSSFAELLAEVLWRKQLLGVLARRRTSCVIWGKVFASKGENTICTFKVLHLALWNYSLCICSLLLWTFSSSQADCICFPPCVGMQVWEKSAEKHVLIYTYHSLTRADSGFRVLVQLMDCTKCSLALLLLFMGYLWCNQVALEVF